MMLQHPYESALTHSSTGGLKYWPVTDVGYLKRGKQRIGEEAGMTQEWIAHIEHGEDIFYGCLDFRRRSLKISRSSLAF